MWLRDAVGSPGDCRRGMRLQKEPRTSFQQVPAKVSDVTGHTVRRPPVLRTEARRGLQMAEIWGHVYDVQVVRLNPVLQRDTEQRIYSQDPALQFQTTTGESIVTLKGKLNTHTFYLISSVP